MAFFDRLRRLVPGRPPAEAFARGAHALERGRLGAAESAFAEALAKARTADEIAAVRNKRAIVAIARGDRELAVAELIAALEVQPRSPAAITTIANLLLEDGALAEAMLHYEYAIDVDPDYAPAYHNLGVALHRSGRRAEAVRMLRKAARLEARTR